MTLLLLSVPTNVRTILRELSKLAMNLLAALANATALL